MSASPDTTSLAAGEAFFAFFFTSSRMPSLFIANSKLLPLRPPAA
jgi:hypothetical protein